MVSDLCRESCESEDLTSLPSLYPSSPTENGIRTTDTRSRPNSKSTLEENTYEDIVGKHTSSLALIYFDHLLVSVEPAGLLVFLYRSVVFWTVGWAKQLGLCDILDGFSPLFSGILWTKQRKQESDSLLVIHFFFFLCST